MREQLDSQVIQRPVQYYHTCYFFAHKKLSDRLRSPTLTPRPYFSPYLCASSARSAGNGLVSMSVVLLAGMRRAPSRRQYDA